MLADFFTVIPQTPSLVLVTYRPEYEGALARVHGTQTVALAPLSDSESAALITELLGPHPTVDKVGQTIADRAAGNPFFAEEIVRELAERGVLHGHPGAYVSVDQVAEVSVPATLQATIAARIDRLPPEAKRTLSAAAVIGSRFTPELLTAVGTDPVLDLLLSAELIDQVRFTPYSEYGFHHPLIRAVTYEAQLKSDRAQLHRRLAAAIQERDPESLDANAALIAEHLEAAGDLHAAFDWHMRAGAWSATRDIAAARLSWERARQAADTLPGTGPDRLAMRIAPRTLLCGSALRVHVNISGTRFEELRDLCIAAGDKASLAIGMGGLVAEHVFHGRLREASRVASEQMALAESIGDPALTVGLSTAPMTILLESGEMGEVLRWSQRVIELADADPTKGNFIIGSPLAVALATRGTARWAMGRPGWRDDYRQATAMGRKADPASRAIVIEYTYGPTLANEVLLADDTALSDIDEALRIAEGSGDDVVLSMVRLTLGIALVHRDSSADCERGLEALAQVRDMCLKGRFVMSALPLVDVWAGRAAARRGDRDRAVPVLRAAVDDLFTRGQLLYCAAATGVLVETLLADGAQADVREAEVAVGRLATVPTDSGFVLHEIWLVRLRALAVRAHGDDTAYRDYRDRYRAMAKSLGFEGHMKWAEAMP